MALDPIKDQKSIKDLTPKQKEFINFLEDASSKAKKTGNPYLNRLWIIFVYGSFAALGLFLIYFYSAFILITK